MDFSSVLRWDDTTYSGELIVSFIAMGVVAILAVVIYFVFRKLDPTKPTKNGFVVLVSSLVETLDNFTIDVMGKKWLLFAGYIMGLALYILTSFFISISGLPNPFTNLACPLSIGLMTFLMIHITAAKANKWGYFKRYTDPICVFLPINLLSMWAPLLSLTLRLFGNALAGYCLMSIVYYYLEELSNLIFSSFVPGGWASIFIAPIITPWLHLYFDVFSGLIQTLVFSILTMIWVSQEDPDEEVESEISLKQVA